MGQEMERKARRTAFDIHDVEDANVKLTHFKADETRGHKEFWTLRVRVNYAEGGTEITLFIYSREEVTRVVTAFQNIE